MTRLFHVSDVHFGREDRAAVDVVEAAELDVSGGVDPVAATFDGGQAVGEVQMPAEALERPAEAIAVAGVDHGHATEPGFDRFAPCGEPCHAVAVQDPLEQLFGI